MAIFKPGETVAWPTNAPEGVDPFTALEVTRINTDGTVEVSGKPGTFRADPSELVHAG